MVERAQPLRGEFSTEPYEAGWASEALIFIKVREAMGSGQTLEAWVQISPDGIDWVDEGTQFPAIGAKGLYCVKLKHFGNWLRVAGRVGGSDNPVKATVYVALKE
ncbi:MAG TPA: hypothetical protein DEP84_28950 [Chloroflexi bacterium]|nr:hypothetical protein [Chloroflexota bacterium]